MQNHLLKNLNDKQLEAVTARDINLLVLAGAGSGKTRVLVHRIGWLIQEQHVSPYAILAVTFTNKAANEMRSRVESLVQLPVRNMWIGTFHHIAHRLLRQHWKSAQLPESFQILDSEDQYRLIRRIIRDMNLDEEKYPAKQLQWYINKQKENARRSHDIVDIHNIFEENVLKVYQEYEKHCQKNGLVDFSELLLRVYELLKNDQELLKHYQNRFQHILVDEFQDTNSLQYGLLRLLVTPRNHIMIVGDDDQSIYSWRGAQVENIQRFLNDFPNAEMIKLEQNYRSTGNILNAANALIANNDDRLGKNLWTEGNDGDPISLYEAFNDFDEARFIASKIQYLQSTGNNYQECAILYRSNAQSRILEQVLIEQNIPYRIYGGLRFFERAEIKNVLAYLRLMSHRHHDAALERIINTPTRGIGHQTLDKVREQAKITGKSLWTTIQEMIQSGELAGRTKNALLAFINLIEQMTLLLEQCELHEVVQQVIDTTSLVLYHKKEGGEKARTRIENLEELVNAAKQFATQELQRDNTLTTLQLLNEFLSQATLEAGDNQAEPETDFVQLMTLHAAKGLEFPIVFLSGLEENIFPHKMSMDEPQGLSEERRLCYVGMTRAKEKLFITHAQIRRLYGYESVQFPSRFIHEIPEEHIEPVRMKMKVRECGSSVIPNKKMGIQTAREDVPFPLGASVTHPKFGEGTILNYQGTGDKMQVVVHFKRAGQKCLALKYANLK